MKRANNGLGDAMRGAVAGCDGAAGQGGVAGCGGVAGQGVQTGLGDPVLTRRAALGAAAACAGGLVAAPRPAAARPASGDDVPAAETLETSAEFNGPYTAWSGYASTARHSIAPGAVPVKAPAGGSVLWTARVDDMTGAAALRQMGQTTYLYALTRGGLEQLDAATGEPVRAAKLPAAPMEGACPVFVDAAVGVVLEDGRVAMFDEELSPAWVSEPVDVAAMTGGASVSQMRARASRPVPAGGAVHVVLSFEDAGEVRALAVVALAAIDGALLWGEALEPSPGACGAPALLPADDQAGSYVLLADGGTSLRLIDVAAGEVASTLDLGAPVCGRIAELPLGFDGSRAWAVGDSAGEAAVVTASAGGLAVAGASKVAELAGGVSLDLLPCAPAVVRGHAFFWAAAGAAAGADPAAAAGAAAAGQGTPDGVGSGVSLCLDVTVAELGAGCAAAVLGDSGVGACSVPLLPVVYGDNAREARVSLYAFDDNGGVASFECDSVPVASAEVVPAVWDREGVSARVSAIAGAQPLVNRDGALILPVAFAGGAGAAGNAGATGFVALAPDEAREAATPVGGAQGIDTLGAVLAGITLPNGAGIGVGALFLAATFGAYAFIRNRGGRGRRDEGVEEWRAEHKGRPDDDDDELERGRGGRW